MLDTIQTTTKNNPIAHKCRDIHKSPANIEMKIPQNSNKTRETSPESKTSKRIHIPTSQQIDTNGTNRMKFIKAYWSNMLTTTFLNFFEARILGDESIQNL